jgi:hypothetical protein
LPITKAGASTVTFSFLRDSIKKFEEKNGVIDGDIKPDINVKPTRK